MSNVIEDFRKAVSAASYHHADDTCQEWPEAKIHESRAREIFEAADEELKEQLREIARGNLIGNWWIKPRSAQ